MKNTKSKTKVSDAAEEKLRASDVRQRLYITKTRWGVYNVLTEEQYERKLIFG
jgi:PHD/YefM family antitoxin component YafN of YafNO toxin-antitoxin module